MDVFGKVVFGVVLIAAMAVTVIESGRIISEAANRNSHSTQVECPKVNVNPDDGA